MKAKGNDKLILELKDQVEAKKKLLKKAEKFSPKTNCSLAIPGMERINLNVADKETLLLLAAKVQCLKSGLYEVFPEETLWLGGYSVDLWLDDITSKFKVVNRQIEEVRLKKLEEKLHNLLSTDTKVGLEIEDLKNQI